MYQFFAFSTEQATRFEGLKTTAELAAHGPLGFGQEVPAHCHANSALYVVNGVAEFIGKGVRRVLGDDSTAVAVLVPAGSEHGWKSLRGETMIEHVIGDEYVQAVMG